jgi:glutamate dehydrogenase
MTGPTGNETPGSSVVDQVVAAIPSDRSDEQSAMLEPFVGMYLRRLSDVDLHDLTPEQLLAEIGDLLDFISDRPGGEDKIRVFRPQRDQCGYSTPGSVVQVLSDDKPFLVDSVSVAVSNVDANIVRHLHPLIGAERDAVGHLVGIAKARGAAHRESVQHFELDRELTDTETAALEISIVETLTDISKVVGDFDSMRAAVLTMIDVAKSEGHQYSFEEISETVDFLNWLLDDNFVLLGYRRYDIAEFAGSEVLFLWFTRASESCVIPIPSHSRFP